MSEFIDSVKEAADLISNFSTDYTYQSLSCDGAFDYADYSQILLIPSSIVSLLYWFIIRRKHIWLNKLDGRPGIVYPMSILTTRDSLAYAACYGVIATLVAKIILESKQAIDYSGPPWVTPFVWVVSMVIYGINCYPLFASVALRSTISYFVGSLFVWALTVTTLFTYYDCGMSTALTILYTAQHICQILSLLYLCFRFPYGFYVRVSHWYKTDSCVRVKSHMTLQKIKHVYEGLRVRDLLIYHPPKEKKESNDFSGKINNKLKELAKYWIYKPKSDFRYSSRILATMWVGFTVLYMTAFRTIYNVTETFNMLVFGAKDTLNRIGWHDQPGDSAIRDLARTLLKMYYYFAYGIWLLVFIVCTFAFILGVLAILYSLMSYRENLRALYRGDHSLIPNLKQINSNNELLHGSIRYAGYQVGYIAWAFFIQAVAILCLVFAAALVLVILIIGYSTWFNTLLQSLGPLVFFLLLFYIIQYLCIRFLFLQDQETSLAIDNRRGLFTMAYFMFFFNIFVGLGSCLWRLAQSLVLGLGVVSRLDMSQLNRKYERFDAGFDRYLGFLYVEYAHTHPVLITFVRLLNHTYLETKETFMPPEAKKKRAWLKLKGTVAIWNSPASKVAKQEENGAKTVALNHFQAEKTIIEDSVVINVGQAKTPVQLWEEAKQSPEMAKFRLRQRVQSRWLMAYTLLNNPYLILERKGLLEDKRKRREEKNDKKDVEDSEDKEITAVIERQRMARNIAKLRKGDKQKKDSSVTTRRLRTTLFQLQIS